jgi:hypothetical protein
MIAPKPRPVIPHVEVADPAEAMRKLGAFAKKLLAVPKGEIDRRLASGKAPKSPRKPRRASA